MAEVLAALEAHEPGALGKYRQLVEDEPVRWGRVGDSMTTS